MRDAECSLGTWKAAKRSKTRAKSLMHEESATTIGKDASGIIQNAPLPQLRHHLLNATMCQRL